MGSRRGTRVLRHRVGPSGARCPHLPGSVPAYPQFASWELRRGEVSTDYPEMKIPTSPQSAAMEHLRSVLHSISTGAQAGLSSYAMMAYAIVSDVTPPYAPPPELATNPTLAEAQTAIDDALAAATTPREMLRIVDAADMLTGATEDAE